mmetsp:Transcript_150955/g.277257  ORF Transcript_150955/g.277257 Transcript_150955/m.277257 type:complete len:881 (-) Transcript_150955:59-2701(-)
MAFMQKLAADPSNARVALENILDMPAAVEEGVQMAKPQGVTPRDGNKVDNSYGSLQKLVRPSTGVEVFGNKAYGYMQQLVVAIAALWLLFTLGSHLGSRLSSDASRARSSAPAPAPGAAAGSQPSCRSYEYPQCKAAMHGYLLLSARSRCEAFERVKAEGDFFKFPYSATSQETCTSPGCCSCPGQCSKCPPILPECSTWQLDGTWKVAFADGTAGKYRFDAHGHCEMELPASALPTTWKAEESDDTAPADAAAGSAPRAGGDGPPGVGKNGMVGRVLSTKAAQVRTGETKREAAPEERKNASTSPRGQRDQGPRAVWQDRRGLLERARFGMKMSQRTEYASLLGSSVSQGSLREDVTNSKAVTRTPSVRTRRRHLAPPPKAGGNPGAGTRTASPGHEFLNLHEHDLVLNVDSLSLSEPIFDAPNQQEPVMLNLVSPMSPPYEGPVLQGRGDAGNGGPNADAARRRDTTAGSSGARRGRSTEDFRSYYERALEHLGSIGTAAVPSGSATADGLDASTGRNIGTEAAATCGVPVAVPSPMPRQGKRGIAREDLAVTEGKPGLAREDPAATEGKPGLAREDPAEESLSLPRGISGDLLPARQSMMPRTVIRAPPEVVVREAREVPGASRISRQKRDDTPQSRTPRGSAPSQATLAFHKLHHSQSPGHPGHSSKVPSPRRRGSDNPMLRRDASSTVRLRPGTASCGNLGSISATQASVSSSLIGSAQAAATRTTSAVVTSVGSTQQHLSHSASAGPAPITIVPPTSASPTAATILTSAKVQGADSVQSPNAGVPPPLLQSMPNSLSGSMLAPRNGIVPRLDFRKVGQPVDRPRGHSGVAPSAAVTPVLSSSQAGTVQQAAQMVSQSAAAQPVQKQTVPTRQSL